jgi:hypothetical protein
MATLKHLLADFNAPANLEFRNNAKPSIDKEGKEVYWSNAFVQDKNNILVCIGATTDTLAKLQAEPKMSNLMLTTLEEKISEKGTKYFMCQLAISKPADFSFSIE